MKLLGIIVCLIVILECAPAAIAQSGDICETVVIPQMTAARLDLDQYGPVLGCEKDGSTWRMRTVKELAPANGGNATTEQGKILQKQADAMAMDSTFTYSLNFGRSSSLLFTIGSYNKSVRTDIGEQGVGTAPSWLNNYSKAYARDMEVFLLNNGPANPDFIDYLRWLMARRDVTLQAMTSSQNPTVSTAFLANWGYMQWPWPWQIADPVAIDEYVRLTGTTTELVPTAEAANTESQVTETFAVGVFHCGGTYCEGLVGVTIYYESADGTLQGSCVTKPVEAPWGMTAWCEYPQRPGIETVLTVDADTLPSEWTLVSQNPMNFTYPVNPDGPIYPVFFEVAPA